MAVIRICKNLSNFPFLPKQCKVITVCLFQSNSAPVRCCPASRNELPSQHWTKRAKIWWCCARLKNSWQTYLKQPVFLRKYICALWPNIAQVTFLCIVVSDVFGWHWLDNILMQCCPSMVDTTLHKVIFLIRDCLLAMDQQCTDNFLMQYWPRYVQTKLQIIFLCKVVCGLWVNTGKVIFLCNVGSGRSRQHCIAYFPAKTCLCTLVQHCTSNFFVQCCLRRIWTTLTRQYSYAVLSQHGQYNIAYVIFLIKVVC